jgi:hypothetical protein
LEECAFLASNAFWIEWNCDVVSQML